MGHTHGFGSTEEPLRRTVFGCRERGLPSGPRLDHTTGEGHVPFHKGDYHDALRHKNNQVALLLVECFGGIASGGSVTSTWRTACRLGPPVLWRRRTFDRRIERCAPAVPQHDRARTSAIPLPAHRPCAAASQQSPAAIVPHGDVGCLVGFRQEGSAPSTPYMRCLIKGGNRFASFAQRYITVPTSTELRGQAEVPKLEPQIEFSVGIFSHERVKHLNFTVRRSGAILRRNLPRTFHQLLLFCSVTRPAPPVLAARESHDPHLLACAGMAVNIRPIDLDHAEQLLGAPGAPAVRSGWARCCGRLSRWHHDARPV